MSATKPSQGIPLWVRMLVALLVVPALLWGDQQSSDKKPAKPTTTPPVSAAGGHPPAKPGLPQQGKPGRPAGTSSTNAKGGGGPSGAAAVAKKTPQPDQRAPEHVKLGPGRDATVFRRPNGRVAEIHTKGMTISHPLNGPRRVVAHVNGREVVAIGHRGGYVQRPYLVRGGRTYVQRTYVVGGVSRVAVYRSYSYGGVAYYGYVPVQYYQPGYYGWAYDPWPSPVAYGVAAWGWNGSPWYARYGGYFAPYPAYSTASLWLTDYLLAENLQAAYAARAEADAATSQQEAGTAAASRPASDVRLSPEVKQMIADQVKRQIAAEKTAAISKTVAPSGDQLPDALNPAERIFVVSSSVDVTTADRKECGLAPGDVIMRMTDSPDDNQNVTASVQSSKEADCKAGQTVLIGTQDLQEMHNKFRQQLDSGLQTLAANAGKGGLPQAPDATTTSGEIPAPMPDANAASQLSAAQQDAEAADKSVQGSGPGGS
jgi:hypothetical protein